MTYIDARKEQPTPYEYHLVVWMTVGSAYRHTAFLTWDPVTKHFHFEHGATLNPDEADIRCIFWVDFAPPNQAAIDAAIKK